MRKVITFGTFDVLHIGHINILKRAKNGGLSNSWRLIRLFEFLKKQRYPVYPETERLEIIRSLKFVDEVFIEESLELKGEYIKKFKADILVMGDDWLGRFDEYKELCEVSYLPRTVGISTTELISQIKRYG